MFYFDNILKRNLFPIHVIGLEIKFRYDIVLCSTSGCETLRNEVAFFTTLTVEVPGHVENSLVVWKLFCYFYVKKRESF